MTASTIPLAARTRWGLPGLVLPGEGVEPRPDRLVASGSLLLAGVEPGGTRSWPEHVSRHGPPPHLDLQGLVDLTERASLRGYGGAAFPTAVKLRSLAQARRPMVIVNAMEGEHASAKDGVLLRHVPHLVLDGALVTAWALGTDRVTVRLAADRPGLEHVVRRAAAERGADSAVSVSVGPAIFTAGEASAVAAGVAGRPPLPAPLGRPPRVPAAGMLGGIPGRARTALVSNVETYARLALVARRHPYDSALATLSGAVQRAGVLELPTATTLHEAVAAAGGETEPIATAVTGGWHGRWLRWSAASGATLTRDGVASVGGRWGAGVFVLLAEALCPVSVLVAVAEALAAGSAGQCGPCRAGLPAVASALTALTRPGSTGAPAARHPARSTRSVEELRQRMAWLRGRGLCAHPTASVDALASALEVVREDLAAHAAGRCVAAGRWA